VFTPYPVYFVANSKIDESKNELLKRTKTNLSDELLSDELLSDELL
jgi:hypothetical protein